MIKAVDVGEGRLYLLGMETNNNTADNMSNAATNLKADRTDNALTVIDSDGGRWWPNYRAELEIVRSTDPAAAAVAMCAAAPMRGEWQS